MPLKFEIDSLDGLDEVTQKLYAQQDNGKYRLAIEGLPQQEDVAGLKAKVEELLGEKKKAADEAKKAKEDADKVRDENARKRGDVEALEKSWTEKYGKLEVESKAQIEKLSGDLRGVLIDGAASRIASEIALPGSANVLEPHIRNRLTVDYVDGKPVTRVLGADGKPSALTLEELQTEFVGNKAFAPIVVATKASGGGASGGNRGGATEKTIKRADFDALDPAGRAQVMKEGKTVI